MGVVYRAKRPDPEPRGGGQAHPLRGAVTPEIADRFQRGGADRRADGPPGHRPDLRSRNGTNGSLFFVMPVVEGENLRHLLWGGTLQPGRGPRHRDPGRPTPSSTATRAASSTATSSPRTSWSTAAGRGHPDPRAWTSASPTRRRESRLTKTGTLVGTVAYLSPEQVGARAFDGRSDIYSLGTVLYECLAGEPPFSGEVQSILYRIVHEVPQPPRALGAEVREELQDIVLQCLQKDPAKRPAEGRPRRRRAAPPPREPPERRVLPLRRPDREPRDPASRRPRPSSGARRSSRQLQHRLNAAIAGTASSPSWPGSRGSARRACSRS